MLVFSKQTEDLLAGIAGCLERLGGLPRVLVWDRQAGIHGHGGRPSQQFAGFCGQLKVGWRFCEPADRYASDFKKLADEILGPLGATPGVTLNVTLEIEATAPGGFDDAKVRSLRERSDTEV